MTTQNLFASTDPLIINNHCCCFNFRKVTRAITQLFDRYLEPTGIRATQFTLLVALSAPEAKTLTDMATSLVMDRTTLTRNLKPIEKLSLITMKSASDKRTKVYTLTEQGKGVLEKALPLWKLAQEEIVSQYHQEPYGKLLHDLSKLQNIIMSSKKMEGADDF